MVLYGVIWRSLHAQLSTTKFETRRARADEYDTAQERGEVAKHGELGRNIISSARAASASVLKYADNHPSRSQYQLRRPLPSHRR